MKQIHLAEHGPLKDIVDLADPVHVMASCTLDPDQEREALSHFQAFQGAPLKFSRLRKTPAGQNAILAFLNSDAINCETAGTFVVHKPHLMAFQYCTVVLATCFAASGAKQLDDNRCRDIANLLVYGMPVAAPPALWAEFLSRFRQALLIHTPQTVSAWINAAKKLHAHIPDDFGVLADCISPVTFLDPNRDYFKDLNPAWSTPRVVGYFGLTREWARMLKEPFDWVVDGSSELNLATREVQAFAVQTEDSGKDGANPDEREIISWVHDIVAGDPHAHPQLALADIVGGALGTAIHAMTRTKAQAGTFATEVLEAADSKALVFKRFWPEKDLDFSRLMMTTESSLVELIDSTLLSPPASGSGGPPSPGSSSPGVGFAPRSVHPGKGS